jgi:hypothetical protein
MSRRVRSFGDSEEQKDDGYGQEQYEDPNDGDGGEQSREHNSLLVRGAK